VGAPLVAGTCSRLVADLNRSPHNPAVIPETSFGVPVPGNRRLTEGARNERIARYHTPYWAEVAKRLDRAAHRHGFVLHVSVHSFTPLLDPDHRKFDVGLLFHPCRPAEVRLAEEARDELRKQWSVELNQPYPGDGDSIAAPHREKMPDERYVCLEVEANQASMRDGWAAPLADALAAVIHATMRDRARRG